MAGRRAHLKTVDTSLSPTPLRASLPPNEDWCPQPRGSRKWIRKRLPQAVDGRDNKASALSFHLPSVPTSLKML